jgi:phosphonate transport system substrate-binding protein
LKCAAKGFIHNEYRTVTCWKELEMGDKIFSDTPRRTAFPGITSLCLLLFAILALLTAGCGKSPEEPPPPSVTVLNEESADLVIALLPERNVFEQKKKYLPLQNYLSEKLDISVYFKLLDNYDHIFAELLDSKVDGGFWGSMNGAIAQLRGGVEILARPVWDDNTSTYWSYIYTRKGSGITGDPATWSKRSIAFVNKATTAGFLYPLSLLRKAGIDAEPGEYFSRAIFSGSHDASIMAVFQGEVDMGASKNTIYQEYIDRHPEVREGLVIIAESPQVPSNGLGVRPDLPDALKKRLTVVLLSMTDNEEGRAVLKQFGALRFIETSFEDYRPVIDMAESAGINLAEWPLRDVRGARPYR